MTLSKPWLGSLGHILRLVVSRGACCLRWTLTFIRRLFALLRRTKRYHDTLPPQAKETHISHESSTNVCYASVPQTGPIIIVSSSSSSTTIDDVKDSHSHPLASPPPSSPPPTVPPTFLSAPSDAHRRETRPTSASIKNANKQTQPFAPEQVQRYQRSVQISRKTQKPTLNHCVLDYSRSDDHEWQRCMHPEGALYFYRDEEGGRTLTDSNVDDKETRELVQYFAEMLWRKTKKYKHVESRKSLDLVLAVSRMADRGIGKYYFASHVDRVVFWLDGFVTDTIFYNVRGVEAIDHIKLAIETQYWGHCELYPNHVAIKESDLEELRGILIHSASEGILADGSLTPLSFAELQQLLGLLTTPMKLENKYLACVVARLMRLFMRLKFINFFGQAGARLNADQSLYSPLEDDNQPPISSLIKFLDIILFRAPSVHVKQLCRIWVDHTINVLRWRSFISTLFSEWNGFTIYSTVMLAVDVSFLSIQEMNGSHTNQIIAQIAIYFSTLSAVGSLLASVLLSNQIREQGLQSADQAASYMLKMAESSVGMDALAIMFSIPFALIMWGMIFFICGLSAVIFGSGVVSQRVIAVPFWMIVAMLATWPAWYAGERWLVWVRRGKKKGKGVRKTSSRSTALPMSHVGVDSEP